METPLTENIIAALRRLQKEMEIALDGLPDEALAWVPGEGMNSLAVLAAHTAGALRYWIGTMVGRKPTDRVRAEEFSTTGLTAEQARRLLADALVEAVEVLAGVVSDDLGSMVLSPTHQREFQVAFSLIHAVEHTAEHTGHMGVTRQLWELRTVK